MKKRILSILLCCVMLVGLLPTVALAESGVSYLDETGTSQTCASATEVTSSDTGWTTGWYVVQGTVEIGSRVTVSGDVHLILTDGCTLTVNGGIQVQDNSTESTPNTNALTIYGQTQPVLDADGNVTNNVGKLIATGAKRDYNAVIGGNKGNGYGGSGGAITINGGVVKATNTDGAGIGGGFGSSSGGSGGTITINGGYVEASSQFGAGIGGGEGSATAAAAARSPSTAVLSSQPASTARASAAVRATAADTATAAAAAPSLDLPCVRIPVQFINQDTVDKLMDDLIS